MNPYADLLEKNRGAPMLQEAIQLNAEPGCLGQIVQLIEEVDWNKAIHSSYSSREDL